MRRRRARSGGSGTPPLERPRPDGMAAFVARERALARRAAELAALERELADAAQPVPAPPEPEPEREPEPEPEAEPPSAGDRTGPWTVARLERLVADYGAATPERVDLYAVYLRSLREVADAQGRLPLGVDHIVEDVFGELLARERSARA